MGYLYYLARDDNRTLFELGKVIGHSMREALDLPEWDRQMMLNERPSAKMLPTLSDLIPRLTTEFGNPYWRLATANACAVSLANKMITWADGHPVVFTGESDDDRMEYEVTGDRYENE